MPWENSLRPAYRGRALTFLGTPRIIYLVLYALYCNGGPAPCLALVFLNF